MRTDIVPPDSHCPVEEKQLHDPHRNNSSCRLEENIRRLHMAGEGNSLHTGMPLK